MGFDELYRNYADAVWGFLIFKLQNEQLAEDLLQETFLAVLESNLVGEVSSPKAWLISIAHHKMVDYLRKNSGKEQLPLGEQLGQAARQPASNLFLREILGQLEEVQQSIIYGLYVEGLSCKELAQILDLPVGTVKSKAHYARKKLREWLEEGSK